MRVFLPVRLPCLRQDWCHGAMMPAIFSRQPAALLSLPPPLPPALCTQRPRLVYLMRDHYINLDAMSISRRLACAINLWLEVDRALATTTNCCTSVPVDWVNSPSSPVYHKLTAGEQRLEQGRPCANLQRYIYYLPPFNVWKAFYLVFGLLNVRGTTEQVNQLRP